MKNTFYIRISEEAYEKLSSYAGFAGKPIGEAADEAVLFWVETAGDTLMQLRQMALAEYKKRKDAGIN